MTSLASPLGVRTAHSEWPSRAAGYVSLLAGMVVALSVLVMLGWFLEIPLMVRFQPDWVSMRFNTAVAMLLIGIAMLLPAPWRPVPAALSLTLMLLVAVEHVFGAGLGIDEAVVTDWSTQPGNAIPGRVPVNSVVCISLLSAGIILSERRRRLTEALILFALATALLAIYGYTFGTVELYRFNSLTPMAMNTALLVVLAAAAAGLSIPGGLFQWVVYGRDWGARLQRTLLPVGLVLLPSAGWLIFSGIEQGTYNETLAFTLFVTLAAASVALIGLLLGREARQFDAEQQVLVEELYSLNEKLEDRVRVRSVQINRQRTRLALLEERDRIARDLHDRVIQRIFAAGLQVAALGRTARKFEQEHGTEGVLGESLNGVAKELDMAIRELRNSIFELTSVDDHEDVEQVLHDIGSRAARILGFTPAIEVSGAIAGLPPDLIAQVASVIQEALSNVARHARASTAHVSMVGSEHDLTVRVTDDGIGLPDPLPRSSGISNLMSRARNLGGSATWEPNDPQGTVLTWRVPRRPGDELSAPAQAAGRELG